MKNKFNSIFALGLLLLISMACNFSFSTANLSDLKLAKDKSATSPATSFKPEDTIFAVTSVNNAMSKNKVKFRLLFDNVQGGQSGSVAYQIEKDLDVDGSAPVTFNFSVPSGFVPGSYKVEAVLVDEDGKELDRKTSAFTITGENASKPAAPQTSPDAEKNQDKDSEDN